MGVHKLWDVVKPLCVACDFYTDAAGSRIAIDTAGWLHVFATAKSADSTCLGSPVLLCRSTSFHCVLPLLRRILCRLSRRKSEVLCKKLLLSKYYNFC